MKCHLIAAAAVALLIAAPGAYAQARVGTVPPVAQDLVGARAAGAETQLETRGLKFVRTETSGNAKVGYWKELGTGGCVAIRTVEGKVASALYASTQKCGSGGGASTASAPAASKGPSTKARSACMARFGVPNFQRFSIISPLKPGYWELQIQGKDGERASCTVSDAGKIEEWVEL